MDDSPANLQLIKSTLEPFGYTVLAADEPARALSLIKDYLPDLILSDVHLHGASGFDLIKTIKQDPRLKDIPFIFLSATVWGRQDQTHTTWRIQVKYHGPGKIGH